MSIGTDFLASLVKAGDTGFIARFDLDEDLFTAHEQTLLKAVVGHIGQYGCLPGLQAIAVATSGEFAELPTVTEKPEYYYEQMQRRRMTRGLQRAMATANACLQEAIPDPDAALEALGQTITSLYLSRHQEKIVDFRRSRKIINAEIQKAMAHASHFVEFGWAHLDNTSIGMRAGDVCSYVGRPGKGKTWFLLWTALRAWQNQSVSPMFVSLEMSKEVILQRLASLYMNYPVKQLMDGEVGTLAKPLIDAKLKAMGQEEVPFWVVDGSRYTTVKQISMLARYLNPGMIVIDGAYMLRTEKRMGRYEQIAETADEIKHDLASKLQLPVFASYQFSRQTAKAAKKSTAEQEIGVEDIFGSDAVGQLSSVVLGLLEEDSVETLERRQIRVLKGRGGEKGAFTVKWDLTKMDFSDYVPKQELTHL